MTISIMMLKFKKFPLGYSCLLTLNKVFNSVNEEYSKNYNRLKIL